MAKILVKAKDREKKKGVRDVGLTDYEYEKLRLIALESGKEKTKKELIHMAIDIATGK